MHCPTHAPFPHFQVTLHGMDEGVTAKLARGLVYLAIAGGHSREGWDVTKARMMP